VAYDFDSLIFFLWPLVAPIYLLRTRGWDAAIPLGGFFLLRLGGFLFATVMAYPHSVAYFRALRPYAGRFAGGGVLLCCWSLIRH
jgi:hypothetical protein